MSSLYITVFWEAFLASLPLPLFSEPTFYAMIGFGGYDLVKAAFAGALGLVGASLINWLIGFWFLRFRTRKWFKLAESKYETASMLARRHGWVMLLFTWMPFGWIITFLAGFFRVPLWRFVPLVLLGAIVHYFRQIV